MAKGFAAVPRDKRFVLANATLPAVLVDGLAGKADTDGLIGADITVKDGLIERIDAPGRRTTLPEDRPRPRHGVAVLRRHAYPPRQGSYLAATGEPGRHLRGCARCGRPRPPQTLERRRRCGRDGFRPPHRLRPRHGAGPHPSRFGRAPASDLVAGVRRDARALGRQRSTCRRSRSSASTRSATNPTPTNSRISLPSTRARLAR